jgi:Fe-S oxidoreductase
MEYLESDIDNMKICTRCSACKFIPPEIVTGYRNTYICPSIARYNFHAYSGGGRINAIMAVIENRLGFDDKLLEVIYNCQMCGGCDVSCKYSMDMEVLDPIQKLRIKCVEAGRTLPALDKAVESLKKQKTMVPGSAARRGDWAKGLKVKDIAKEKAAVVYHAGCRSCYDAEMAGVARANIQLLQKAGVDIAIEGNQEACCGGRAYEMGYKEEFLKQAEANIARFNQWGVKTIVTGCAECYQAFKVLYDKFNLKGHLEIIHTSEYFARLIKTKKLKFNQEIKTKVTYHDPCHLGRLGEKYIHWEGKRVPGHIIIFDPPKEFRRGTYGVYEPPRDILKNIPGVTLIEMERIKEYAWCCGAGGGVKETNAGFSNWAAKQRIEEAESTGAEAIVTSCPGCEQIFKATIKESGSSLKVYDLAELLVKSAE